MKILAFETESACSEWLIAIEAAIPHQPGWSYAVPTKLVDGRWFVQILPIAEAHMTVEDLSACEDIMPADIAQVDPV